VVVFVVEGEDVREEGDFGVVEEGFCGGGLGGFGVGGVGEGGEEVLAVVPWLLAIPHMMWGGGWGGMGEVPNLIILQVLLAHAFEPVEFAMDSFCETFLLFGFIEFLNNGI
jgi:hypothetical protein